MGAQKAQNILRALKLDAHIVIFFLYFLIGGMLWPVIRHSRRFDDDILPVRP